MKDVKEYEDLYAVTSCGKVWSHISKKFLKPRKKKNGYLRVMLCKDGKRKEVGIHRLVAEAYIPNPDNLKTVDHINGNREQNYIKNLQWMTLEDNVRKAQNKKVCCVETGEIFESGTAAAKEKNLTKATSQLLVEENVKLVVAITGSLLTR